MDAKTKQDIAAKLNGRVGYELGYTVDALQFANPDVLALIEHLLNKIEEQNEDHDND